MKLYKSSPYLEPKIWGGPRLVQGHHEGPIGEVWTHSDLEGKHTFPGLKSPIPYLVKLIDAKDNLSVQVHPNDELAAKYENSIGKTECWLVLDAPKDRPGLYMGLRSGVTKSDFEKCLEAGEDASQLLSAYTVSAGDFFYIPAGTIHAIGAGTYLAEVQRPSGITYRLWDWNRIDEKSGKGRELHIDKGLMAVAFEDAKNQAEYFRHKKVNLIESGLWPMVECEFFKADILNLKAGEEHTIQVGEKSPIAILLLRGRAKIRGSENELEGDTLDSFLGVDSDNSSLSFSAIKDCSILITWPSNGS